MLTEKVGVVWDLASGCEDKGYSSGSGSIGVNTTEIEHTYGLNDNLQPLSGHSCSTDPEMCIVGVGKNS